MIIIDLILIKIQSILQIIVFNRFLCVTKIQKQLEKKT